MEEDRVLNKLSRIKELIIAKEKIEDELNSLIEGGTKRRGRPAKDKSAPATVAE